MERLNKSFKFLTSADFVQLQKKMRIFESTPETVLIKEGEQKQALFLIQEGSARVEKEFLGASVPFSELRTGDIYGEMSLIEQRGASATVICNEACKIAVLTISDLKELVNMLPGFEARFYHSLAYLLSVRLRETNEIVVPGMFSSG